ncbi:hypothetical protein AC579_5222 [Pseudocercospora musae]|uniref:Uncharacterized protein n=1 Tax=Pseudocercospora musae TaxID=113226 RepID=A0A139IDL7_9PEZI|nr:hypothetical protein AC579_5222 [Pseudocercospora musae]
MEAPYHPSVHDAPVIGFEDHDPEYLTKYDMMTEKIFNSIKLIAAYDCRRKDHPVDQLCSCPRALKHVTIKKRKFLIYISFVLEWEQHILASDAALRFRNDQAGKDAFLTSQGISAEDFARAFAEATFASPTMIAPASDMDEVVDSMLAF